MNKGQYGYIDFQKNRNIISGLIYFGAVLIAYFIGNYFASAFKQFFYVISALLILPTALFLSRYLLYNHFRSGEKQVYDDLAIFLPQKSIMSDLVIVRGRITINFSYIVFLSGTMICLVNTKSKNLKLIKAKAESLLNELLASQGIHYKIKVYTDQDNYVSDVMGVEGSYDSEDTTVEQIKSYLIQNSI